jgi:excisionase family DNA binding protein
MIPTRSTLIIDRCVSVQAAAEISGYSAQYLRRLLRAGKLAGVKLGQIWLIRLDTLEAYLDKAEQSQDLRFGAKNLGNHFPP